MIKYFKNFEAIKWYKNGEFTYDDTFEDSENEFKVGDIIKPYSNVYYWDSVQTKGGKIIEGDKILWQILSIRQISKESYTITDIDYYDSPKDPYNGQVLMLKRLSDGSHHWPWFQTTGFKKEYNGIRSFRGRRLG